jgi:hypothetical protein
MRARPRKGIRRKGIYWEYNLDGASPYEVVKGFWKRYWRRWSRRLRKQDEQTEDHTI